jgi:hypothetical protein
LKLKEEVAAAGDDDEDSKKDLDPKGFKKYHELLTGKLDFVRFVECCTRQNPDSHELQYQALKYFLLKGKSYF